MNPTTWSRWSEIQSVLSELREDVVIDCGHVSVRYLGQKFRFGSAGGVSETALMTFMRGLTLSRLLRAEGRRVKLNICLSDTSRLLSNKDRRRALREAIAEKRYSECLPPEYLEQLTPKELDDLVVMLQTRNSNRFTNLIKKAKTKAKAVRCEKRVYQELGTVMLKSHDDERFAVSGPFLMNAPDVRDTPHNCEE